MENSQQLKHKIARKGRAKDVNVIFTDPNGFVVLKEPITDGVIELNNIKYFGYFDPIGVKSTCGCMSFYHGNSENYVSEHGTAFVCKHLFSAAEIRGVKIE